MSAKARHGHTVGYRPSPTYSVWLGMIARCTKPKNASYARYKAAGITVCERWRTFDHFLADMGERPDGKTIERIDNNGIYEPSNCRWATMKEQANNRRTTVRLEYGGRTLLLSEWAKELGLKPDALSHRIRAGWSMERVMTEPRRSYPKHRRT